MNSIAELLGMIATEAVEGPLRTEHSYKIPKSREDLPTVRYDLRLVKYEDGTFEWKD